MSTEECEEKRRPKFDGTVNLGHILTACAMLTGGFVVWNQSQIVVAKQDARLLYVEQTLLEVRTTIKSLAETQQLALRNQDKVTTTMEILLSQRTSKP